MNTIEKIEIINRDGISIPLDLVSQSGDVYTYKVGLGAWATYIRCGFEGNDPDKITFLDPPGGPMFHVGYQYEEVFNMTLTEIKFDKEIKKYLLTFRKVN